ncbi:uncharacterized protein B0H64DRAFT_409920 [Chaetomium fimeti]|uniref:Uncharacterized protein n=1 Tax=Chaetomium fimeti TaxID=1854472 RepID=A0AAE0H713_9PEZI|nr:hypothetical protein B0H64DRAFT_409920 [Chaetomium fimeti]
MPADALQRMTDEQFNTPARIQKCIRLWRVAPTPPARRHHHRRCRRGIHLSYASLLTFGCASTAIWTWCRGTDRPIDSTCAEGESTICPWGGFPPSPCFHGLLLSCRTIYAEAAPLLYAANSFVVHYSLGKSPGLQPLRALTAVAVRSLSNLKIVVNEAACHRRMILEYKNVCCRHGHDEDATSGLHWCQRRHCGLHQVLLLSPVLAGNDGDGDGPGDSGDELAAAYDAEREWHSAAAHIFPQTVPSRLSLSLVCDIDPQHPLAVDLAGAILAPLASAQLRECRVRLAVVPNRQFDELARDAALHTCTRGLATLTSTQSSKPPPGAEATTLATLPRELRIRILEYTDLVTPRRQVTWSREDRGYVVRRIQLDRDPTPDELYSEQFLSCWENEPDGCFCRRRHAAFSLGCKCWIPPAPLFLLCHALSQDAQYVFFSSNRFIIHDYKADRTWQQSIPVSMTPRDVSLSNSYPDQRFIVSEFLREVVPEPALAHIRYLELVFPPYPAQTWPRTDDPAMRDWRSLVEWLQNKMNLPRLTLKLVVVDGSNGGPKAAPEITTEEGDALMKAYKDLLQPIPRLAELGLAQFYAHFPYPWEGTPECRVRQKERRSWVWPEKKALKCRLERYVMRGRYESQYADGKKEPVASDWDMMYLRPFPWY